MLWVNGLANFPAFSANNYKKAKVTFDTSLVKNIELPCRRVGCVSRVLTFLYFFNVPLVYLLTILTPFLLFFRVFSYVFQSCNSCSSSVRDLGIPK